MEEQCAAGTDGGSRRARAREGGRGEGGRRVEDQEGGREGGRESRKAMVREGG